MKARCIYGLIATDEPELVRYVGMTARPYLCQRITGHRYDAKAGRTSPVCEWIRTVIGRGADIAGVALERTSDDAAEAKWIDRLRAEGAPLLNSRSGGGSGGSFDAASRERLSRANVTAFQDPEKRRARQGENGANARLTEVDVIAIRAQREATGVTHKALAVAFGIDRTTVGKILSRQLWGHI